MFPRSRRLSRSDFSRPGFRAGRRFSSPHFSATLPGDGTGYAVVISKKTIRLSVKRHLLKRRILSALKKIPLPPTLVIYPKTSALDLSFAELTSELATLLGRNKNPR